MRDLCGRKNMLSPDRAQGQNSPSGANTRNADENRNSGPRSNSTAGSPTSSNPNTGAAQRNEQNRGAETGSRDQNRQSGQNQGGNDRTQSSATNDAMRDVQPEQRAKVVETLKKDREARTDVKFSVSVGASVPQSVRFHPLPRDIVELVPQYRGYDYVVANDEIVIIEPKTRKIVTVLNESGRRAERAKLSIPSGKRKHIVEEARRSYKGAMDVQVATRVGERLPESIRIEEFPETIITDEPDLRGYDYVVVRDNVLVVDPDSREIVEVLE
jgi:hypothetical protein